MMRSFLTLVVAALASTAINAQEASRTQRWREDLRYLVEEITRVHPNPFLHIGSESFNEQVQRIEQGLESRTDIQIIADIARLVASIRDSHTTFSPFQAGTGYRVYPIRLQWFPDGLFVTQAAEAYAPALGRRVVRIQNQTAEEAFAAVRPFISHETEQWARNQSAAYLVSPELLFAVGIIPEPSNAVYTFADADGTELRLTVAPGGGALLQAPELSQPLAPLYRRNPGQYYWFDYLRDSRTLYIKYNRCRESPALPFSRFVADVVAFIEANRTERVVIDLRNNGGGNSAVIQPLLTALFAAYERGTIPRTAKGCAIIGRQTFSSASLNTVDLKRAGLTLIGEPTGGGASGFGEVRNLVLPNSTLVAGSSTRLFQVAGFPGSSISPDVLVELTSADYFADRDPVLEAALRD